MRRGRGPALGLALLLAGVAATAQPDEPDEQTLEHAEQDRRYLERLRRQRQAAPEPAAEDGEAAFFARADELLRDRNYRAAQSERYRVQSDDPRLDAAAALRLLEAFHDSFESFWSERLDLAPLERPGRVLLFYSFHEYSELLGGAFRRSTLRPSGHYGSDFDVIALHTDADGGPAAFADSLVHEAAHRLVELRIYNLGHDAAAWVAEGLASYFGSTLVDDAGRFHHGRIGAKQTTLLRDTRGPAARPAARLERLRKQFAAHRSAGGPLLQELLWLDDPAQFYGRDVELHYGASWLLVHFLLHGDEGRHAPAFARFLRLDARGEADPDALCRELGLDPNGLEAAWAAHVERLRAR
jgi:hypothetical protein